MVRQGFSGKHLIDKLIERVKKVISFDNLSIGNTNHLLFMIVKNN